MGYEAEKVWRNALILIWKNDIKFFILPEICQLISASDYVGARNWRSWVGMMIMSVIRNLKNVGGMPDKTHLSIISLLKPFVYGKNQLFIAGGCIGGGMYSGFRIRKRAVAEYGENAAL